MTEKNYGKRVLAFLFLLGILWCAAGSAPKEEADRFGRYLRSILPGAAKESSVSIAQVEKQFTDSLSHRRDLIELNGSMAKKLGMRGFYSGMGMYITDDGYVVSISPETSTDYEYEQMLSFRDFLEEKGIRLLYVNEPTKYTDDSLFREQFGIETYSNRNADHFLARIREAGIPVIDLREDMAEAGMDVRDMFYRTDHHWTTRSALWAARRIAEGMNEYCGLEIDLSVYDEENFSYKDYTDCWLGEQGRKLGKSYVGLDDFTEIRPLYPTSYTFIGKENNTEGTFDDFINDKIYRSKKDVYGTKSWHYSYSQKRVINHLADSGKVLILGDSYEQVTEPFLSLGTAETNSVIMRSMKKSIRDYIEEGDYDTVVMCYAQFMIGAHDNPTSANRNMFRLE